MEKVRIGIIGIGGMGSFHAQYLVNGEVPGAQLTAVCDVNPERLKWVKEKLGDGIQLFDNAEALILSGGVDAVMIATPHYFHPPLAILAFEKGLHVLCEKPAGVYTKQVREMNDAAIQSGKVFSMMYNQRTNPLYQKLRELIRSGELGEITRTNWIITNWFRTQAYYNSGGWRATWGGEGGGVLLNQDPHQLDLWQWTCGIPKRVRAFCGFGKFHDIEVEDDVTAYVEYENGATGIFVTTTGEAPGTNRFEIAGDKGKIVIEDGKLTFWRLRVPRSQFLKECPESFAQPECWQIDVPVNGKETGHAGITTNWVEAILKGTPLLAPGIEGINGLQISNAMHLSAWTDNWVSIPVDEELYHQNLNEKIESSTFKKVPVTGKVSDVKGTF
jgi:predicted dehydrogenase